MIAPSWDAGLYGLDDIERAAVEYVNGHNNQLAGVISGPAARFSQAKAAEHAKDREELERLAQFRSDLGNFCKAYTFLSQIVDLVEGARHNTDVDFYQNADVLNAFVDTTLAV